MKMNQIASVLNNTIEPIATGKIAVVTEDLTNIVDVGNVVLDYVNENNNNFNNYVTNLIDQIGRTIFWDRTYTSKAPNIMVDSWEYGSIMMKTRVEVPDFTENVTWNLQDIWQDSINKYQTAGIKNYPVLDPFELSIPEAQAKFYNKKNTFELPITIGEKQLKQAFTSASEMQRFISMIENRIRMKQTIATDALIYRTIANFMGLKIADGNYVDLMAAYNTFANKSYTTYDQCVGDPEFLRFASKVIDTYKSYMQEASVLFNNAGYVSFTPDDRMKFVLLKDFEANMKSQLYSTTFHDDYVKLGGYEIVNDWQGSGTTVSSTDRRILNIVCTDGEHDKVINAVVVAAIFDRDGCAVCNEDPRVTSQYNPRGEYTNFFYKWDANYINDNIENGLIFTIGTPTVNAYVAGPAPEFTMTAETDVFDGVDPDLYQSNITVTGNRITGTLYKDTANDSWTSTWGKGYFIALKTSGNNSVATTKAGLIPSAGSGLQNLDGPGDSMLFHIADIKAQKLAIAIGNTTYTYDLSGLTLS